MLIALIYLLFPEDFFRGAEQRWNLHEVTIKGFGAGVTREQIEARLGPGSSLSSGQGWIWAPPLPPVKPGDSLLPSTIFEVLTLEKRKHRWFLSGSQFEYGGRKFITQMYCADSIRQGTLQRHFGRGSFSGQGADISLDYRDADSTTELSFTINTDQIGLSSARSVTGTSLSWPEPGPAR